MKKRIISALAVLMSAAVWADAPLSSQMDSYLVTHENGKEVVVEAEQASPGDIVEYRLTYTNNSDQPLSGLVITGPIPTNTVYLKDSAATQVSADFTVSIDNGDSFQAEPVTKTVTGENGQSKNVEVSPSDYTQVRWQPKGSLQPDQVQQYRYRVTVQ
ncbi:MULTISPECIES: DUF11 domain-containing protein [unclassified Alcanivorax]|uniref:DUF11 domain-containing protein n=1 Tax=unclassified Alcanivorax TaxID=2638842 RepID=UPI0007BA8DEB|nr:MULTISPECIES: DUF11 domain-containing protein [unclassified Alcanivorax]PHR64116.1 MAG: DUF11 domain-containing protein [Alcanivorax sp.]